MSGRLVAISLLVAGMWSAACAQAADLPPGATVLDPDIVWDVANPHSFAISPDGKQIAYISKGALWVCPVDAGPPSKLADLPNTITAILAEPGNQEQRENAAASPQNLGFRAFYGPVHLDKHYVFSLAWTPDQRGVAYAVRKRVRENSSVAAYHVMHAPLGGAVETVAIIEGEFGVPDEYTTSFHVTPDRKRRRTTSSCHHQLADDSSASRSIPANSCWSTSNFTSSNDLRSSSPPSARLM